MVENCEICGEELDPDEEDVICRKCKDTKEDKSKEIVTDYIDPGVT